GRAGDGNGYGGAAQGVADRLAGRAQPQVRHVFPADDDFVAGRRDVRGAGDGEIDRADKRQRESVVGIQLRFAGGIKAASGFLGGDEQIAGHRINEQGFSVTGPVGIGERNRARALHGPAYRIGVLPGIHRRFGNLIDFDTGTGGGVIADVTDVKVADVSDRAGADGDVFVIRITRDG